MLAGVEKSLPARERGSKRGWYAIPGDICKSLPARERGSKRHPQQHGERRPRRSPRGSADRNGHNLLLERLPGVAPRAGARIETLASSPWKAGLPVAPRAGARIETSARIRRATWSRVAPRAGARIETVSSSVSAPSATSLPARERGSKRAGRGPVVRLSCRSPRGSADRNPCGQDKRPLPGSRSPRGSADRNYATTQSTKAA